MTDVDDERLGELFRAAAGGSTPPPGFDHEGVVRASRRATVRRRTAVTGAGLALVAVLGIGGTLVLPEPSDSGADTTVAAPMLAPAPEGAAPRAAREAPGPADAQEAPSPADPHAAQEPPPPAAGDAPDAARAPEAYGGPVPLGPGRTDCADRHDPALRAIVEEFLPEVAGAPEAATTMECRPGGERGVNVEVRDGEATGLLTVQYLPPGAQPEPVEGAVVAPTASGGTVVVSSRGDGPGTQAPFADRLDGLANHLSPRL
ncbi:hypothetical protein [Pseudonocardia sp. MH-G8]|uniref:hypothetical protein n=1 Tax=Pseudonocardia sp. MH-G8 TaxID=1854588 RepID=UPI000BA0D07B|nr:hypothetical protein [Pseudonocardia sp. MH-G8]OZM84172.1 hypothetical protein CFP66_07170 [Pseudonocardia sp. MH-G8]